MDIITEVWYKAVLACEMTIEIVSSSYMAGSIKQEYLDEAERSLSAISRFYIEKDTLNLELIKEHMLKLYRKAELQAEALMTPIYIDEDYLEQLSAQYQQGG